MAYITNLSFGGFQTNLKISDTSNLQHFIDHNKDHIICYLSHKELPQCKILRRIQHITPDPKLVAEKSLEITEQFHDNIKAQLTSTMFNTLLEDICVENESKVIYIYLYYSEDKLNSVKDIYTLSKALFNNNSVDFLNKHHTQNERTISLIDRLYEDYHEVLYHDCAVVGSLVLGVYGYVDLPRPRDVDMYYGGAAEVEDLPNPDGIVDYYTDKTFWDTCKGCFLDFRESVNEQWEEEIINKLGDLLKDDRLVFYYKGIRFVTRQVEVARKLLKTGNKRSKYIIENTKDLERIEKELTSSLDA